MFLLRPLWKLLSLRDCIRIQSNISDPGPLHCRPGFFPVLESCEEEEYCEQPDFSWLKYGRICTVMYYFTHQFIGTDNHWSWKSQRGLALKCLPGSTVLCIQNPDVDFKEREKLQLSDIIKNLHVSFETSLEASKRLDPDPVKYFGSYQIHFTADLGFSLF